MIDRGRSRRQATRREWPAVAAAGLSIRGRRAYHRAALCFHGRIRVGAVGVVLTALGLAAAGCAANHYASPAAARPAAELDQKSGQPLPMAALPVFRNRAVTIRVLDNRMDRPQSAVLVDEVSATLNRVLEKAQVGTGPDPRAVLEVRILRYAANGELSKWRACVGFGATVEIAPARRHELATERCATAENVWGTESADEALRAAFQEAVRDLVSQLDSLPAVATPP